MEEATGLSCSVRHLHSPLTFAFSWRTDKQSPRVVHAVTATCLQCKLFSTFAEVTGGGAMGRACDDNNPHSLQQKWNFPTYRRRVAHSVTVTYGPLCMFLSLFGYATIVEKVTTITCNTFSRYGSVAPWVSWGGICRVDIPAAGRAFCDSDVQAVMHVSLALLMCHDRWKGHHNYMQDIQSIWQRHGSAEVEIAE